MKIKDTLTLLAAIAISELAGIIGSLFTVSSLSTWYATLAKPSFTPPGWIFGPVWTTLFVLMGIAAFLVYKKGPRRRDVQIALAVCMGQLVLNTLWSFLFFGLHRPDVAFIEIIILWGAIVATIILFERVSKGAALLLVPYILWVSFALYLNYSIWQIPATPRQPVACTQEAKVCPDGSAVGRVGPDCAFAPCP